MKPQITVIIPCRDSDDFIGGIISDLSAQTIQTFHVVFVDDHSTRPLKEVLAEFAHLITFPYTVIETEAGTAGGARNAALDAIKAPFTYFVDSDDRISPTMLEYALRTVRDFPQAVPMAEKKKIPYGTILLPPHKGYYNSGLFDLNDMHLLGRLLFRSDVIRKHDLRFAPVNHTEDFLFIADYVHAAGITGIAKHTATFYRVERPGSVRSEADRFAPALPVFVERLPQWVAEDRHPAFVKRLAEHIAKTYAILHS